MKRVKKVDKFRKIKSRGWKRWFTLFFWRECERCDKEFIREWGWVNRDYPRSRYICNECMIKEINE